MRITRTSPFTNVERTREINITEAQYNEYQTGTRLIQHCMPLISDDDREFIMTGITEDEWDEFVPDIDEDECGVEVEQSMMEEYLIHDVFCK